MKLLRKEKKNEFKTTLVKKAYVHTHMTTAYLYNLIVVCKNLNNIEPF